MRRGLGTVTRMTASGSSVHIARPALVDTFMKTRSGVGAAVALTSNQTGRAGANKAASQLVSSLTVTRKGGMVYVGDAAAYNATSAPAGVAGGMRRWVSSFASPMFDFEGASGRAGGDSVPPSDVVLVGSPLEDWHYMLYDASLSAGLPPEAGSILPGDAVVTVLPGWLGADQWTLVILTQAYDDTALLAAVTVLVSGQDSG